MTKLGTLGVVMTLWAGVANATTDAKDLLVKFTDKEAAQSFSQSTQSGGARVESLGLGNWVRVVFDDEQLTGMSLRDLRRNPKVVAAQPNHRLKLLHDFRTRDESLRRHLATYMLMSTESPFSASDNPAIPAPEKGKKGADPLVDSQWGMKDIGAPKGWSKTRGKGMIVAVIDTGVDYTHEDLVENLWRNPGEIPDNGVDDDGNGFIDDTIGWDFVSNDNKPFDLALTPIEVIFKGGNPGHGTHCAGNVAAKAGNGRGIAGVAPDVKIMSLRFLSEKGEGTTADAIKSIMYAVNMGAKVLSNSWGSEGEDPTDEAGNLALREAVQAAEDAGALFIAAAGNGHSGVGYDNDSDAKPAFPASYDHDIIVSVAALDSNNALGSFSNWGAKSVDIGAPGVVVFSTTVGGKYSDVVVDLLGIKATWDGTSMAAPHVAGAAALYWAANPEKTWREVKAALLDTATPIEALDGKAVSNGKLNVEALMNK